MYGLIIHMSLMGTTVSPDAFHVELLQISLQRKENKSCPVVYGTFSKQEFSKQESDFLSWKKKILTFTSRKASCQF